MKRLLYRDGDPVPLTPKAVEFLLVLLENRGRALEKHEVMRAVGPTSSWRLRRPHPRRWRDGHRITAPAGIAAVVAALATLLVALGASLAWRSRVAPVHELRSLSLAVLPLVDLSADSEQEYLTEVRGTFPLLAAGENLAGLYSLIATCEVNGREPGGVRAIRRRVPVRTALDLSPSSRTTRAAPSTSRPRARARW